jgi:hypothetical protein
MNLVNRIETMKDIGMITLLSVIATAAAPTPPAQVPLSYATAKSTQQFAACFAKAQERRSRPWAFVPRRDGGTFSNLGAPSVDRPYFLVVTDRGVRRLIQLQDATPDGPEGQAVNQCL